MLLYIVRHAEAGQHGDPNYPDDSLRPLTKKGRKRFSRLVKKLARHDFAPTLVATSPLVRCRQTAQEILDRLDGQPKLLELTALAPSSELAGLIAWTNVQHEPQVAWVGHAPDVDRLTAGLIGTGSTNVEFAKGAIAAIEFEGEIVAGEGELRWLVTPTIV
jgi:phosphohistidine phosphatase SixA